MWQSGDPVIEKYLNGQSNDGVYRSSNFALYTYTANNPIVLKDPDGKEWFSTITAEDVETRRYLEVNFGNNRRVTMFTDNPASDLSGNWAIVDGRRYRIRAWSNPGGEAFTPRPVTLDNAEIPGPNSTFGVARPTVANPERIHGGIDISSEDRAAGVRGASVTATGAGRISLSRDSGRGTGNSVTVNFGGGNFDQNFHLGRRDVDLRDWVNVGQQIGTVGSTGLPTGNDHLHYQTTRGGIRRDPQTELANPYPVRGATTDE